MNPTFSHFTKGQHVPGGYQQQSGQTIFNIGAFGPYPITMSHAPANIFVNQPHLHRTFASVVSCENPPYGMTHHFEEPQNLESSGIFNSVIKRLITPQQPNQPHLYQPQYTQKEFEDFTKIPTVIQNSNPQPTNYANSSYTTPLSHPNYNNNFETMKVPFMNQSAFYQQTPPPPTPQTMPPKQQQHHNAPRQPRNNFFNTLWGNFYAPQHQQNQQQKPNNSCNKQRWYQKGFPRFYRNNNQKQQQQNRHHSRFHHHDASNPKHMHEKERHSIERDIQLDYCDINKSEKEDENRCKSTNPETAKPSTSNNNNIQCDNSEMNPPFEIFSLEEFPAIVTTTSKQRDVDHDFVTYKDDAAVTTPSYTPTWPKRISLCEKVSKIVKSPQKLLPLTLATPRRSCLKPTQRNRSMSECSDDFIVFEYSCDDGDKNENFDSDEEDSSDDESESEMSDDDTIMGEESEDMDEVDEAMRREDEKMQCDHQPDSGIDGEFEPKKVQFNLTPTVHVMHAWNHAYRASRDGREWRQGAIDRERFKKRCSEIEEVLKPILQRNHRDRILSERFKEN